jgi:anti-sigma B factor antagonist
VETAIGVFTSRDQAEKAFKELRERGVPEESIVFLIRSENEEIPSRKTHLWLASFGGAAGVASGVVATLVLPGIGTVLALGLGAASLLGLAGAGVAAANSAATEDQDAPKPAMAEKSSDDAAFFREVLREGRSLIVVRTESQELATTACAILDRLGLGMQNRASVKMQTVTRHIGDVAVLDIRGRITLGEGNVMLRDMVRELIDKGNKKIVLNLGEVQYLDSSGIGELVKVHTTVKNQGGHLKLVNLSKQLNDLLQLTRLSTVFEIEGDEASAIRSLGGDKASQAVV